MTEHTKESAIEAAVAYLKEGMQNENVEMCLVIADTKTGNLRIIGLNMPEEEVPLLLCAAAEEMSEAVVKMYNNRTLN
jgi:hypothetical protein